MPARRHGMSNTKEHDAWSHMKSRCYRKTDPRYPYYGGRGIEVCDRWKDSFDNFLIDMGKAPTPKHSLDRLDNNGPYSPENCRWATKRMQMNNVRTNLQIKYEGMILTLKQWSRKLGFNYKRAHKRLLAGWTFKEVIVDSPERRKK